MVDFVQPIIEIVKRYNAQIKCYNVGDYCFPPLPVKNSNQRTHLTKEAYFRLFLTDILSPEIDKALWLDCDMVVVGDLLPLWEEDISNYAVGCVPDFENNNVRLINLLGYDACSGYFNSGVLLINLMYWREKNVIPVFIDYISTHGNVLHYCYQDVLNYVFHKAKKELSFVWNFQTTFLYKEKYRNISCKYFEQIEESYKSPCIIHYTEDKPWFRNSTNPKKGLFIEYQNMTIWEGMTRGRKKLSLKNRLAILYATYKEKSWPYYRVLYNNRYLN